MAQWVRKCEFANLVSFPRMGVCIKVTARYSQVLCEVWLFEFVTICITEDAFMDVAASQVR